SWIDTAHENRAVSWVQETRYSEANLNLFRERTYIYREIILLAQHHGNNYFVNVYDSQLFNFIKSTHEILLTSEFF
ncbi:unnamed protein product, partial [Schistosoma turkestanicum]